MNTDLILLTLRMLEWNNFGESMRHCPCCGSGYKYGHVESCQLALSLKELGEKDIKMIDRKQYPS